MDVITTTKDLHSAVESLQQEKYITVDTEFIRESTFWPKLCLIQIAGENNAYLIDSLSPDLKLSSLFELLKHQEIVKVFHAARQDLEIIHHMAGFIPQPLFDTQIAASVLGYGDTISYDALVRKVTGKQLDKSHRFTDWARRPLKPQQLEYALADVTHLRNVYYSLFTQLNEQNRISWMEEEMSVLLDEEIYRQSPENAWKRLKTRVRKPRQIAVLMEVAAWREEEAQSRDLPRGRVIKDEAIYEVATHMPSSIKALGGLRSLSSGFANSDQGKRLLEAINKGKDRDPETVPRIGKPKTMPEGNGALADLLRVLLKMVTEEEGVASRVIATSDDLEAIAADDNANVPALKSWRRKLFGEKALQLKSGRLCLGVENGKVKLFEK